tara:strand:+ start:309 stop:488 length:180 start_codon:yes stop_codon:yes gene_type:complete
VEVLVDLYIHLLVLQMVVQVEVVVQVDLQQQIILVEVVILPQHPFLKETMVVTGDLVVR